MGIDCCRGEASGKVWVLYVWVVWVGGEWVLTTAEPRPRSTWATAVGVDCNRATCPLTVAEPRPRVRKVVWVAWVLNVGLDNCRAAAELSTWAGRRGLPGRQFGQHRLRARRQRRLLLRLAAGETSVTLLHPPLPSSRASIWMAAE